MAVRALVATSTLAWGINMPARRCVVLGTVRGLNNEVSPIDIKQMVGRAGRTGLDERGDAYVFVPEGLPGEFEAERDRVATVPPIASWLERPDVIMFHAIAEMECGSIRRPEQLVKWHSRSLAATQGHALTLEGANAVFELLKECHSIEERPDRSGYRVTGLGRVASWLYLDPRNIWAWVCNFNKLEETKKWDDDAALSFALGSLPLGTLPYVSKDAEDDVSVFDHRLRMAMGFRCPVPGACEATAISMLLDGAKITGSLSPLARAAQSDIDRTVSALKLIDTMYARWGQDALWETLPLRVRYGVGREMLPLVRLPGIGGARAKKMWETGFTSLAIVANPDRLRALRVILGATLGEKVHEAAKEMLAADGSK